MYQQTLLIVKRLAEQNKSNVQWQQGLAWDYGKLGDVLKAQGKLSEAQDAYQQRLNVHRTLADQYKSNSEF